MRPGSWLIFAMETGELTLPTPAVDAGCSITVRIENRIGASSPYDAQRKDSGEQSGCTNARPCAFVKFFDVRCLSVRRATASGYYAAIASV